MATYYSSLYSAIPNRGYSAGVETVTTSYVYKGPSLIRYNEPINIYCSFTSTTSFAFASTDSIVLCPALSGVKLLSYDIQAGADLDSANDFTFNLGFTGALTGFLSASTGLQATTVVSGKPLNVAASTADTNSLILSAAAGALETAGTLHFALTLVRPQ